ncbi:MAG: SpoIIE family protein phosphatase [Bacteroidales bacterium]|nr:SpoIIE family protein phosphatase [Bacteroidales bacterium]
MQYSKIVCFLSVVFVLVLQSCAGKTSNSDIVTAEEDTLVSRVQNYYCSGALGMRAIKDLHEYSLESGNKALECLALEYKAGTYVNMSMFSELDEFVDSLEMHTTIPEDNIACYYFVLYTQVMSNVHRSRFKLAIQQAKKLYEVSRDIEGFDEALEEVKNVPPGENDLYEAPVQVSCRLSALRCLATAYMGVNKTEDALVYINEGIEIASVNKSVFSSELLDLESDLIMATYRLESPKFRKYSDGEVCTPEEQDKIETLKLLKSYDRTIKELAGADKTYQLNYFFYDVFQRCRYIDVYCDINERARATHHYMRLLEIINGYSEASTMLGASGYKTMARYNIMIGDEKAFEACLDSMTAVSEASLEQKLSVLKMRFAWQKTKPFTDQTYEMARRIVELTDSMSDNRFNSSVDELGVLMGIEKYEKKAYELAEQKRSWVFFSIIAVLVTLIFAIFVEVRRGNERREMLAEQKKNLEEEVVRQTSELREKNRDITASINYAQKIQEAILPDIEKYVRHGIDGAFSICRPCEIVSGDFYWATMHGDDLLIACADCTGHGVPGALMSMIGSTVLNEVCSHVELPEPEEILEELDRQIIDVMTRKDHAEVKDGMDVSIMAYNTETHEIRISSARGNVVIFKGDECIEVDRVRRSIGDRETRSHERKFVKYTYNMSPGDIIYMATDGIMDQFGGQGEYGLEGVRFTKKRFVDMLRSVKKEDMSVQRKMINEHIDKWRGSISQIDDITILGIRF